jgi:hypothetical protein
MNARAQFAEEVFVFSAEDPILSALAEAERAIDSYLVAACDGDAHAGKIVTRATRVRETADLLSQTRLRSPGDLVILGRFVSEMRALVSS